MKYVFKVVPPVLISVLVLLILWQWAAGLPDLQGTLPSATATVTQLWTMLFESSTWVAAWETLRMALIGWIIAMVIAIPLGLLTAIPIGILIGLSRFAYMSTKFTFNFLRVIPGIVITPLAVLVFGPTQQMGIFLVAWPIVFLMLIQTSYGVRDTDPTLIETMKCYQLGTMWQIGYARIPSAGPLIALGIRIGAVVAVLVAVVAGLIGGAPGLGREVLYSQLNGQPAETFAIVLLLGCIGLLVSKVVEYLQPKIIFWVAS